ncbi:alpha/beta fold hydrolase [Sedimenticola selenatireducens]|nr:alpha/beta hydrolase [Sedimenticola selenatireducens]
MPTFDRIQLADGRNLSYSLSGAPRGRPVLYCHGMPGSAYEVAWGACAAELNAVSLIAPERPGYGGSEAHPAYSFERWAEDVAFLLDHLGIPCVDVLGYSAGGAFAIATAHKLSKRVRRLILVSSVAPYDSPGCFEGMSVSNQEMIRLARQDLVQLESAIAPLATMPEQMTAHFIQGLAACDQSLLSSQPELCEILGKNTQRALQQGGAGLISDLALLVTDWAYLLSGIAMPVALWQGEKDHSVPPAMTSFLSKQLPTAELHSMPEAGHLLRFSHWEEILRQLSDQTQAGS